MLGSANKPCTSTTLRALTRAEVANAVPVGINDAVALATTAKEKSHLFIGLVSSMDVSRTLCISPLWSEPRVERCGLPRRIRCFGAG